MTKTWFLSPTRELVKASQPPSGDHDGFEQDFSPRVTWKLRPDGTWISQTCVTKASCFQSVDETV